MKTPSEWNKNIDNHIITEEMLDAALFCCNKRAKNYRDQKRKYRGTYDKYHNFEKCEDKENEFYRKKDKLLKLLKPVCIHKEFIGFKRTRTCSYEANFDLKLTLGLFNGTICHSGHYYEPNYRSYDCDDDIVEFFDTVDFEKPEYNYYLFYILGNHSYHTPIKEYDIKSKYSDVPVIPIDRIMTEGHDIVDLASVAFTDKLIALIETNDYRFTNVSYDLYKEEIYESDYKNFLSEMKEKVISDNIENTLSYWGDYIAKFLSKKLNAEDIAQQTLSQEEIDQETAEYSKALRNYTINRLKSLNVSIESFEKNTNLKKKEKQKDKLIRKISDIDKFYKEQKNLITSEMLSDLFYIYDSEHTYAEINVDSLDDIKEYLEETEFFDSISKIIAVNKLRRSIFDNFKENELIKYTKPYISRIEKCYERMINDEREKQKI